MKKILIINGPNLNLLGERNPELYGNETLEDINNRIGEYAKQYDIECRFFQSNHEGALIDCIQEHRKWMDGLIINPAAYTHTSVALHDAIKELTCPVIEVHLSNIYCREEFRHNSFVSSVATGIIAGFGPKGYILAIDALVAFEQ
jgi:3-dehydroquinate dehydratase-2